MSFFVIPIRALQLSIKFSQGVLNTFTSHMQYYCLQETVLEVITAVVDRGYRILITPLRAPCVQSITTVRLVVTLTSSVTLATWQTGQVWTPVNSA